jgi:hypothetical protein
MNRRKVRDMRKRKIRKMRDVGRCTGAAARDRGTRQLIICQEWSMTDSMAAIATAGLLFITHHPSLPPNPLPAGTTPLPHDHRSLPPNVKSTCRAHTVVVLSGVRYHLHTSPAITGADLNCHSTSRSRITALASASTRSPAAAPASQHLGAGSAPICVATSTPSRWPQASACATTFFPVLRFF